MSSTAGYPPPAPQGPWQQHGGQHSGHPSGPLPTPPASNSMATAALVVGLVAVVMAIIPVLGLVSWILAPLALIFGVIGVQRSAHSVGRSLAIWGIVLGSTALVICVVWAVAFVASVGSTSSTSSTTSSSTSSSGSSGSSGYGSYSSPYSSPSYIPAAPTGPLTSVTSGTYEVGNGAGQVPPGRYTAPAGSSSCYYERMRDLNGSISSIIDNGGQYDGGQVIVEVKSSDAAFKVSGDCTFTKR